MITCPECGQQAADDAKFCDRCGQGLASTVAQQAAAAILPLEPDTELKTGYRIAKLLSHTAHENRYRTVRLQDGESVQLREQRGPMGQPDEAPVSAELTAAPSGEDLAGPRAKTAELRLERSNDNASSNGSIAEDAQSESADGAQGRPGKEADTEVSQAVLEDKAGAAEAGESATEAALQLLTEAIEENPSPAPASAGESSGPEVSSPANGSTPTDGQPSEANGARTFDNEDLGDVFGRVLALSMTLKHPAFQRATVGFADRERVYLVYPDEELRSLSSRPGGLRMEEGDALQIAIQVCQAVSFVHRRGLRVNDICPDSIAYGADGRIKLTGLDYLSNDNELQSEPIFNDGYTAPEIYRGKKADKRANVFSVGALLYTCTTGERLDSETWREEAGPIRFIHPT